MNRFARATSALALALAAVLAGGCGAGEQEGRDWVKRVVRETPRIAQLLFHLPSTPVSSYNATGQYPEWIGDITYRRFTWTKMGDSAYRAEAVADVAPGTALAALMPAGSHPSTAHVELTVDFVVHVTPPPVVFLPSGKSLQPTRWTLHRVDGRAVDESGGFVDYRE